jgi:hypothetical protein
MRQFRVGLTQAQVKKLSSLQQLVKSKVTEGYHYSFKNNDNNNNNNSIQLSFITVPV